MSAADELRKLDEAIKRHSEAIAQGAIVGTASGAERLLLDQAAERLLDALPELAAVVEAAERVDHYADYLDENRHRFTPEVSGVMQEIIHNLRYHVHRRDLDTNVTALTALTRKLEGE